MSSPFRHTYKLPSVLIILLTFNLSLTQDNYFTTPNFFKLRFITGTTMGLYLAVVVPIDLPGREAYLGWFFEAIYSLPSNETSFEYPPLVERGIDRKFIYEAVENKIKFSGYPGKPCLLRAICEVAMQSVKGANGIIGDILHILLTPTSTTNFDLPPEYERAEIIGQKKRNCSPYKKNCSTSFIDLITWMENTL